MGALVTTGKESVRKKEKIIFYFKAACAAANLAIGTL